MISRVLIIDDEPDWQETLKDVFASVGCDADSVADISGAKELLKTTPYELIILDIFLNPTQVPLNYEGFLTFIARAYPAVIVVAVTGKQLPPDEAFRLSRLGVWDFIYKPRVHVDDVRRLAHRILDLGEIETRSIETLEGRLERIEGLLKNGIETLSTSVAEVTGLTRAVIKLASADVSDCPRLFTLKEASGKGVSQAARVGYLLTLWCEYPGAEHAWEMASYKFSRPREWLRRVAPYGLLVSRVLSVVISIAASIPGAVLSGEDFQRVQNQLELMKEIAAQLPQFNVSLSVTSTTVDRLTPEEGAGLRALRSLLLIEDRGRIFGDLRKVGTESGEIIWVCPRHEEMLRTS
jgi:CheY-like chemotaxis protein